MVLNYILSMKKYKLYGIFKINITEIQNVRGENNK